MNARNKIFVCLSDIGAPQKLKMLSSVESLQIINYRHVVKVEFTLALEEMSVFGLKILEIGPFTRSWSSMNILSLGVRPIIVHDKKHTFKPNDKTV